MNPFLKKLLAPRHIEYLSVDRNLMILETSRAVRQFADRPEEVSPGKDVRASFPELIGAEEVLKAVFEGKKASFEVKGIARFAEGDKPFYIDLYISQHQDEISLEPLLLILLEDVTENMVLKQALVQRANEASLLVSALASSQDYIHKIITSMADALLVTTSSGQIKTINPAAQKLFGYSEAELLGQPVSLLIKDQQFIDDIKNQLPCLNGSELLRNREVVCSKKEGDNFLVDFSCSCIQADGIEKRDFVYIGRDITERKRAEAETQKALETQKELNQMRANFISMTSHEFRTPLTVILTSVELLENFYETTDKYKPKVQQYFKMIENAIRQMADMLDEVLLLSKAEAGKLTFHPSLLDVKKFSEEIVAEMQFSKSKKHTLKFTCPPEKVFGWVDEKLLRQILVNLLSNAIKYSPQGGMVRFDLRQEQDNVSFEIEDEGMGILKEDQERLFESFYRGRNVNNISGTGLGLAIVKSSVDLHGGEIIMRSEVGKGTVFQVILPLKTNTMQ
ncbi:PAS domain-containing sensor histidine kinase [Ancylothrix sp. C2]|uniref:sensor histidine kinase n=1 Tax=Ancylothrix sp. D3o TaxID=2953691 RepID=UPI0021BAA12F|nr:PAS domain-containing sensor histidine kinase [Ancylothrix sp. D3o]MCT7948512.1 PAS domain-containing sensor histidine kinase [Ancylothrix sp. D3o]